MVTFALYFQIKDHEFVNYDDQLYIRNPAVRLGLTWEGAQWAFSTTFTGNWHPLTWLSHMADRQLFGSDPAGHHLVSAFFHAVNSVLLFFLIFRMTGSFWKSGFVAALFAVHPLHVESVAWASERKDLLSAFFWILSIQMHVLYVQRSRTRYYLASLALFLVGMMAKPMVVTLPFVLLILDWWPLNRFMGRRDEPLVESTPSARFSGTPFRQILMEKIPFFIISAIGCLVTLYAQEKGGALSPLSAFPLSARIANAFDAYCTYLVKTIYPVDLAVIYPLPTAGSPTESITCIALFAALTLAVLWQGRHRPYLLCGWLIFCGTLVPVIGLVQAGVQSMADRYTYLPLIGLFIIFAWGLEQLTRRVDKKSVILCVITGITILYVISWRQIGYWRDSASLFAHAVEVTSSNYVAEALLGASLEEKGKIGQALKHYHNSLAINPDYPYGHFSMGLIMLKLGMQEKGCGHLRNALLLKPDYPQARQLFQDCR